LLADQQHVHATQSDLYEKTVADLRQELDAARTQLKESKDKVSEPSSLLLHLQKELLSVKVLPEFSFTYFFCVKSVVLFIFKYHQSFINSSVCTNACRHQNRCLTLCLAVL